MKLINKNCEKLRQREIGKQLLMVNIIQCENGRRFSWLDIERFAEWASMKEEEIKDFVNCCGQLDRKLMDKGVAWNIAQMDEFRQDANSFYFLMYTFRENDDVFLMKVNKSNITQFCKKSAKKYYEDYNRNNMDYQVGESLGVPDALEDVIIAYMYCVAKAIEEVVSYGYDWDVISKMLQLDLTRERFEEIKKDFYEN